jgi:tetratricopeptide (TPR) repeat protein
VLQAAERAQTADLWFVLGDCYQRLGEDVAAEEVLRRSLEIEWMAGTALTLGRTRMKLGKHELAIADFSAIIERLPESIEAYVERGVSRGFAGDRAGSLADLERAVSLPVACPQAHREFARALLSDPLRGSEQIQRALRHARVACASALNLLESLPVLIDALAAAGEMEEACRAIDRLVERLPEDDRAAWSSRRQQFQSRTGRESFTTAAEVSNALWG